MSLASYLPVESRTSTSVLTERPTATREPLPPHTVALIWIGMGVAVALLLVIGGLHWRRRAIERASGQEGSG